MTNVTVLTGRLASRIELRACNLLCIRLSMRSLRELWYFALAQSEEGVLHVMCSWEIMGSGGMMVIFRSWYDFTRVAFGRMLSYRQYKGRWISRRVVYYLDDAHE